MIKRYIKIILTIFIVITVLSLVGIKLYLDNNKDEIEIKEENIIEQKEETDETGKKYVDIKGAVAKPGVYEVVDNTRVIDIVKEAGGLTDNADTTYTNLSQKVKDEMVIIIYTKDQIKESKQKETLSIKEVNNTCICPKITNDTCITKEITAKTESTKENNNEEVISEKININEATLEELQTLTGIGESKAKAIIEYRQNNGKFNSIEDIMNVSGIGEALYNKIKDNITV